MMIEGGLIRMEQIRTNLREALTHEVIEAIIAETDSRMKDSYEALSSRTANMPDAQNYQMLVDYCYQQATLYLDNPDNMKKVLVDSNNIASAYHSMVENEEFKALLPEEYKGFPRIIMMTVLAGSEANAAISAASYLEAHDAQTELVDYEDKLAEIYRGYLQDALDYGNGKKKVVHAMGDM